MSQYGNCQKCGAENALSKQNKVYCTKKCWLNPQTSFGTTQSPVPPIYQAPISTASQVAQSGMKKQEEDKWDRISFGKCKHAFLIEAFKLNNPTRTENVYTDEGLNRIELEAERWAKRSMRILEQPKPSLPTNRFEFKKEEDLSQYGEEISVDQIPF